MRDVLAKGSPLDLHPRTFPPGNCAQSLLAKTTVLIPLLDDDRERGPSFDLYVARSFAPYLWIWLEDAGREYGVPIATAPCRRASEGLRLICQGAASRGDQ